MSCQIETSNTESGSCITDSTTSPDYLKCNLFDMSKLHGLRRVLFYPDMVVGNTYWVVHAPRGRFRTNWKQKITFLGFATDEELDEEKTVLFGECSIMDGNYTFTSRYSLRDHAVFFCDE